MALLGEDGKGYDLARKLEICGVWRRWLGEGLYSTFAQSLLSPSAWDSFMSVNDSKSRVQIQLQLRVRALLYDKATISLYLRKPLTPSLSSALVISKLNTNCLQLHGDDLYFTLEDVPQQRDGSVASNSAPPKVLARANFGVGSRYSESEVDNMSRFRREELPETWYNQFIEKYRVSRPYVLSSFNRDSEKRTPSAMANYLRHCEKHKRRRIAFKEDPSTVFSSTVVENNSNMQLSSSFDGDSSDDDCFFPETMFVMNCVPDSAISRPSTVEEKPKVEFFGVLEKLPQVATKNSIMIERLGISMDQKPGQTRCRLGPEVNKKQLSQEQAVAISKKVIARSLATVGFEGSSEAPVDVLSQFLCCHISKLGNMLRVLADSYRKQCSATELLRMFLRVVGHSNLGALAEYIKDGKGSVHQTARPVQSIQGQMQLPHQNSLQMPQQIQRPLHRQMQPQMQQLINPQNLTLQQQQHWAMRRAQVQAQAQAQSQANSPRPAMSMEKDNKPLVQVKIENPDIPMDGSHAFNTMNNSRHPQFNQLRQHHFTPMQQRLVQATGQYRPLNPLQMAQMQQSTQNVGVVRAPPVKVEGFQELMGGDSSLKHEADEKKLTSPSK